MDSCRRLLLSVADPDLAGPAFWALHDVHLELGTRTLTASCPPSSAASVTSPGRVARPVPARPALKRRRAGEAGAGNGEVGDMDAGRALIQHIPLTDPPTARPPGLRAWNTVRVAADMVACGGIRAAGSSSPIFPIRARGPSAWTTYRPSRPGGRSGETGGLVATVGEPDDRRSDLFEVTRRAVDMVTVGGRTCRRRPGGRPAPSPTRVIGRRTARISSRPAWRWVFRWPGCSTTWRATSPSSRRRRSAKGESGELRLRPRRSLPCRSREARTAGRGPNSRRTGPRRHHRLL